MKKPRQAVTGDEDGVEGYRKTVAADQQPCRGTRERPGVHATAAAGHNAAMSEWVVFGVVAVIVGILVVLLRLGVGDDD